MTEDNMLDLAAQLMDVSRNPAAAELSCVPVV